MKLFECKVALVTGAGSGIGRATALLFAKERARVVVATQTEKHGVETVDLIDKGGGESLLVLTDVSKPSDCEKMVLKTLNAYGRLDTAFNNAGIGGDLAPLADYPLESWQQVLSTNLSGIFYSMKYEIPVLLKGGGETIVNMSSILGQEGFGSAPAYTAAKHGVVGLTQSAALDYSGKGIRINSVGPAFIETPMIAPVTADKAARDGLIALHPIGRLGKPQEVAELVIWLSSDKASFITGSYYPIDGGYLAR
jgi:NAD(P)-dependent dehydrogenase (short-subunit alcohol dehydrogenase family)